VAAGPAEERETTGHRDRRGRAPAEGTTGELGHRWEAAVELDHVVVVRSGPGDLLDLAHGDVERRYVVVRGAGAGIGRLVGARATERVDPARVGDTRR